MAGPRVVLTLPGNPNHTVRARGPTSRERAPGAVLSPDARPRSPLPAARNSTALGSAGKEDRLPVFWGSASHVSHVGHRGKHLLGAQGAGSGPKWEAVSCCLCHEDARAEPGNHGFRGPPRALPTLPSVGSPKDSTPITGFPLEAEFWARSGLAGLRPETPIFSGMCSPWGLAGEPACASFLALLSPGCL